MKAGASVVMETKVEMLISGVGLRGMQFQFLKKLHALKTDTNIFLLKVPRIDQKTKYGLLYINT